MNIITTVSPSKTQRKVFTSTIEKFKKSQLLKERLIPYLETHYPNLLKNPIRKQRIRECCNMVAFRRYLETGDVQLVSSNFCKYDRICIACATKRAMRMIKKFSEGMAQNNLYEKKWYYIVLTISHKQGDKLSDLMDRLMLYKERLARAYRNSKRDNQPNKSFFSKFDGMVTSIEIAHKGKNGRHPHINILACSDKDILIEKGKYWRGETNHDLLNERKAITDGTSYIHNIRHIEVKKDHFSRSGIGEVFKYAIKFSDLTMEQLAEVMSVQAKNQYRFFATYGIFRGWEVGKGSKYEGSWKDGVFLYDRNNKK
ncbi:MAG TPA: protein rep, partial [Candidatus Absconditabacterales bacterium]|nr:protein rep [Candidatus Absconditabacterales bacterium]